MPQSKAEVVVGDMAVLAAEAADTVAADNNASYTQQYAPVAVFKPRFLFSPVVQNLFIVGSVINPHTRARGYNRLFNNINH